MRGKIAQQYAYCTCMLAYCDDNNYPHMPIGKVWTGYIVYCLFFVCACTVTDVSAEDKASGVRFCTSIHQRPTVQGTESPILVNFAPIEAQNRTNRPARKPHRKRQAR